MIAVIDFGGQYAHLIATRVRSFGVFTKIYEASTSAKELQKYQGIILSGGPQCVSDPDSQTIDKYIFDLGIPIMAICYGHQLTAYILGGTIVTGEKSEFGPAILKINVTNSPLFKDVELKTRVWMSHNDQVENLPENFEIIASTSNCRIAAMQNIDKQIFSVQFHPEVVHTKQGMKILGNFVDICKQRNSWKLVDFIKEECQKISSQVGDKKVFLLVSGGVDSTVCFSILEKSLEKNKVFGAFIDTGLMRKNESSFVEDSLKKAGFINLHIEKASEIFLSKLEGISDPEQKRKIIGNTFLEVQRNIVKRLNLNQDEWLLGQGTIYPDTIESGGTKNADTIKTHHNRVQEIQELIDKGKIIEPLKDLYKDEVREVGRKLGLKDYIINRHPFPGPGLGVRILCSDHSIFKVLDIYEIDGYKYQILPIKSVGVQGDSRTYRNPALLYLNNKNIDWNELEEVSLKITNSNKNINRVIFSLSHFDPINYNLIESYLSIDRIQKLQEVDYIINNLFIDYEQKESPDQKVWQFPVVLLPLKTSNGKECIVLRPIYSEEAMTAEFAKLPKELLQKITNEVLKVKDIGAVFFDLTNKPPGTIEWE